MIPEPQTDGRLVLALDDFINPKVGKKIKGRWACIPLAHRFYLLKKQLKANSENMKTNNKLSEFRTKLEQAVDMLIMLTNHFVGMSILCVCNSWFGNNGLFAPAREKIGDTFHLLSRLRCNLTLFAMPPKRHAKQRGRTRKYGERLGSTSDMAAMLKDEATEYLVNIYSKRRKVMVSTTVVMLQTLRCPIRIVFVYRQTQWVALFTTDMSLSIKQIIEFYGARWKI